jgi:hypothetical protein
MKASQLVQRLGRGELVVLNESQWARLANSCDIIEQIDTKIAGDLLLVRCDAILAAIECPRSGERVVRPVADLAVARRFIAERLAAYDRIWDGCGCRIDYYDD